GYLEGGYVEAFFRNDVPRLELAEDAVYHALVRGAPDLDRELGEPLARAATDALTALAHRLEHWGAVVEVQAFDIEVGVGRALERELAIRLIDQAPTVDRIIADGKHMFAALARRYLHFESHDRAEERHASVAAASVIAKVARDERFAQIRARYEPELGPITGGGYANAATRRWLRLHVVRYGRLPDETRLTWPHPYVED